MARKSGKVFMRPTSFRLTKEEHDFLSAAARQNNTTIGTLVRDAAIKIARDAGAQTRSAGTVPCTLELWPHDAEALNAYTAAHIDGFPSRASAARAAMRVGLIQRGYLRLPEGAEPD